MRQVLRLAPSRLRTGVAMQPWSIDAPAPKVPLGRNSPESEVRWSSRPVCPETCYRLVATPNDPRWQARRAQGLRAVTGALTRAHQRLGSNAISRWTQPCNRGPSRRRLDRRSGPRPPNGEQTAATRIGRPNGAIVATTTDRPPDYSKGVNNNDQRLNSVPVTALPKPPHT